jgi:23S rRNA (cytosine1962-C5)-methyltransferase
LKRILLRKNQERRIKAGHPWVFSNELWKKPSDILPGEVVEVADGRGHYLGTGFYNGHSLISVRLFSRDKRDLDAGFISESIAKADALRQRLYPGSKHYRMVYGESDGLPGLVVDRYGGQLVVEIQSLGLDIRKKLVIGALKETAGPDCIYERSDSYSRKLEGLGPALGVLHGEFSPEVEVEENGLRFRANLEHGQKTGWYYDQRENRAAIRQYAGNARVLDCFCHTGGFALNAAAGGAASVLGLDISEKAIEQCRANAALNGLEKTCVFEKADVMQVLKRKAEAGEKFDMVILDPPAFARNKKSVEPALKGYKEINLRAMQMLPPGGMLVSCSCSHHIEDEPFRVMLVDAARDARRTLVMFEFRHQAKDHPVLMAMKETQYLKCAVMRVE